MNGMRDILEVGKHLFHRSSNIKEHNHITHSRVNWFDLCTTQGQTILVTVSMLKGFTMFPANLYGVTIDLLGN